MCRQFIREFADLTLPIFMFDKDGNHIVKTLDEVRKVALNSSSFVLLTPLSFFRCLLVPNSCPNKLHPMIPINTRTIT